MILAGFILSSCAPVLREDVMKAGDINVNLSDMVREPAHYKGKLFILGGIIADTKLSDRGSVIEALYVPVNSRGYLKSETPGGRFKAILPRDKGELDPLVFKKDREITLAGVFMGTSVEKTGKSQYTYPLFEIRDIYLWDDTRYYYYYYEPYPYNYYRYPYWWYDPQWGRYPPYWR